jgi:hypothetical protein
VTGYLIAAHLAAQTTNASGYAKYIPYLVPLVIGLVLGRLWGRRTGLKHLGEAEFQTRWRNVRSLKKF